MYAVCIYIYTCHMIYYSLLPIYIYSVIILNIIYRRGIYLYIHIYYKPLYLGFDGRCWTVFFFSKTRADDSRMQTTNEDLWLLPDSSVSLCTCMPFHARTQTHIISITSNILLNHNFEYILYTITVSHSISHWIPIFIVFNSHGYPYVN